MQGIINLANLNELAYGSRGVNFDSITFQVPFIKRVTDPDQFVPLFTCLPRRLPSLVRTFTYDDPDRIPSKYFPHTMKFFQSIPASVCDYFSNQFANFIDGYIPSHLRLKLIESMRSREPRFNPSLKWTYLEYKDEDIPENYLMLTSLEWAAVLDSLESYIQGRSIAGVEGKVATELQKAFNKITEGGYPWIYSSTFVESSRYTSPVNSPTILIKNVLEGLAPSHDQISFACINPASSGSLLQTRIYTRWYYLSLLYPPLSSERINLPGFSLLGRNIFAPLPTEGPIAGLFSMFCLMVKAKYRKDIMFALWTGKDLADLDIKRGDIELWEDAALKNWLESAVGLKKAYISQLQSKVRNGLKCPVRVFPNLTEELFDIKKEKLDTPKAFTEAASVAINNAKDLVKTLDPSSPRAASAPSVSLIHVSL